MGFLEKRKEAKEEAQKAIEQNNQKVLEDFEHKHNDPFLGVAFMGHHMNPFAKIRKGILLRPKFSLVMVTQFGVFFIEDFYGRKDRKSINEELEKDFGPSMNNPNGNSYEDFSKKYNKYAYESKQDEISDKKLHLHFNTKTVTLFTMNFDDKDTAENNMVFGDGSIGKLQAVVSRGKSLYFYAGDESKKRLEAQPFINTHFAKKEDVVLLVNALKKATEGKNIQFSVKGEEKYEEKLKRKEEKAAAKAMKRESDN